MRWCLVVLLAASWWIGAAPAVAAEQWAWPLEGPHEVSRAFAPPAFRFGAGHRGADLPSEPGAVVRAAGAGSVSYAGLLAGRGVVVIVHGDLRTTYEPVEPSVVVGAQVAAGASIGRLAPGHPGCPVPACLHWGLRRGEDYLDPVRLVDRPLLRLLPVGPPVARDGAASEAGAGRAALRSSGGVPEPVGRDGGGRSPDEGARAGGDGRPVGARSSPSVTSVAAGPPGAATAPASPGSASGRPSQSRPVAMAALALTGSALVVGVGGAVRRGRGLR